MLCVLLMLHVISPVAGARTTTAHRATVVPAVVVENGVAVVRVMEIAPMMLITSTQAAFKRPWTTSHGSGAHSLKWTLTNSNSDLSYISRSTSKWVTDSLSYDAASDPAVKGSVALLLSVCEAGQAFIKDYVLDDVAGSDGVTLSAGDTKKLTAGGLKYCRQRRQQLIKACETTLASLAVHAPVAHRTEVHCAAIFHDYVRLTRMKRDRSAKPDYVDALRKQHETAMRMHEAATWTGTHTPMALPTSPAVQPAAAGAAAGAAPASPLWGPATCGATVPPEQVVCFCKSDSTVTKAKKMGLIVQNRAVHTIANNADKRMMAKRLALSFTKGSMPTAAHLIKKVVEVGFLFTSNLFHNNDQAMVKMLKTSVSCAAFPTPCGALSKRKEIGTQLVQWGRQYFMRQYAFQFCQSKEDYSTAIIDLSSLKGFPLLEEACSREHLAFSYGTMNRDKNNAVGKGFHDEFHRTVSFVSSAECAPFVFHTDLHPLHIPSPFKSLFAVPPSASKRHYAVRWRSSHT